MRECGIPLSDVEAMGYYDKLLVLGYKPKTKVTKVPADLAKPAEFRRPRFSQPSQGG